jgi:hypothetical protein
MSDELAELLQKVPDEIAKQLLNEVFKKKKLFPWTSLNSVKSQIKADNHDCSLDKYLYTVLTVLLEQLRQSNPTYANILERIYWKRTQTKKVARDFCEEYNYAPDSGTFFKWFKEARYQFGTILLEHEKKNSTNNESAPPLEQNEVISIQTSQQTSFNTTLSTLSPLEPEQRVHTRNAKSISTLGITLFRLLPAFQYEFCEMLANGGQLRILLIDPDSPAIEMASKRSDIGTPAKTQKRRVEDMLELLSRWKSNIPSANIQVKLLDYLPAYGITVIYPRLNTVNASCLVRLFTFRTSTSTAPTIKPDPVNEAYWFEFFCDQFEKMWEFAKPYDLLNSVDRTG